MSVQLQASLSTALRKGERIYQSSREDGCERGRELERVAKPGCQDQILICQLSLVNRETFPDTPIQPAPPPPPHPFTLLASSSFNFSSSISLPSVSVESGLDINHYHYKSLTESRHHFLVLCTSLFCVVFSLFHLSTFSKKIHCSKFRGPI